MFELVVGRITIGRGTENSLALPDDRKVSRLHASIEDYGAGWSIRDLGSRNGTYVNGSRLWAERGLRSGDEIRVGGTVLRYESSRAPKHEASVTLPEDWNQGTVTVLFTDAVGSTELRTSRGDDAAHRVLRAQSELIRKKIVMHGGREVKETGDGVMAAFASARRAVTCAADIQRTLHDHKREVSEAELAVRIGVNSGDVSEERGDLFGAAVNAAARVAANAQGGEILVSGVVKQLAGRVPGVSFVDRGWFRLKGFEERWQLFEVAWGSDSDAAAAIEEADTVRWPRRGTS
jgi:class 3 adenylate cyclase